MDYRNSWMYAAWMSGHVKPEFEFIGLDLASGPDFSVERKPDGRFVVTQAGRRSGKSEAYRRLKATLAQK
jgi:hypothetical protein